MHPDEIKLLFGEPIFQINDPMNLDAIATLTYGCPEGRMIFEFFPLGKHIHLGSGHTLYRINELDEPKRFQVGMEG